MKNIVIAAALLCGATLLAGQPAQAAGCIKGAVVGGAAGHYVAHHGWLGAAAGCAIGHHEATKRAREQAPRDQQYNTDYR
jgi:hypothetical protein